MAKEVTNEQLWFAAAEFLLARAFIGLALFVCGLRAFVHIGREREEALRKAESGGWGWNEAEAGMAADEDTDYWKNDEKWKVELLSRLNLWTYSRGSFICLSVHLANFLVFFIRCPLPESDCPDVSEQEIAWHNPKMAFTSG